MTDEYVDGQHYMDGVPIKTKYDGYKDLRSANTIIDPILDIYNFNHKAGLVTNGYDDFLEDSMAIEESLENYDNLYYIFPEDTTAEPKEIARGIVSVAGKLQGTDVDRLDKCCDRAILAIGGMTKLGLNPDQITRALNIVMKANYTKLGNKVDKTGKLSKQEDFVGPESELQLIIDEVTQ